MLCNITWIKSTMNLQILERNVKGYHYSKERKRKLDFLISVLKTRTQIAVTSLCLLLMYFHRDLQRTQSMRTVREGLLEKDDSYSTD